MTCRSRSPLELRWPMLNTLALSRAFSLTTGRISLACWTSSSSRRSLARVRTADPLVNHPNFLGIWQEIYDVTLSVDETGKQLHKQNPAKYERSEPGRQGRRTRSWRRCAVASRSGTKAKKGGKSTVILPDDFGWLAQQFAVDGSNVSFGGSGAAYRWDIHDDQVINKKTKKDVQHPYCQTYYPWTDANGFNLYKEPPTGEQGHLDPAPVLLRPGYGRETTGSEEP